MSVWESLKYQLNRKVDTNDYNYKMQFVKEGETGLDRIKGIWNEWYSGEDNPEVRFIMSSIGIGGSVGLVFGGMLGQTTAVSDFMRRYNEYVFRGDLEAKRKIRDTMILKFLNKGFRLGWRVALFSGLISGLTTTAIAYRNDVYYTDCIATGAFICSLWKIKLGLRAMTVSGVLGGILGLMFAGSLKLLMYSFNTSVPEYRYWRQSRYLGHLTVDKYSDGTIEYNWTLPESDDTIDNSEKVTQQPNTVKV